MNRYFVLNASMLLATVSAFTVPAAADIVTTLPDGIKAELYARDATLTRKWGTDATKQEWETGIAAEIAMSADGKTCYIKNAVGNFTDGYLVGQRNGDEITFTFPQTIISGENEYTVAKLIRNTEPDSKNLYIPDPQEQTISFRYSEGRISEVSEGAMIGMLTASMNWTGKNLSDIVYKKVDTTETTPPEGLERFNIALSYGGDRSSKQEYPIYRLLSGCQDNEYLYIQGIDSSLGDKWMKVKIDGKKASVSNGQYLGVYNERVLYFCTVLDSPEWNQGYQSWDHEYSIVDGFEMEYDASRKTFRTIDPNNAFCVNAGDETYNYGNVYLNTKLTEQPLEISLKPQAPFMDEDVHYFMNGTEPELVFQLLPLNENGQLLSTSRLGYQVYQNDKLYVFDGYEYWLDDEEDITFIPWLFQSAFVYSTDNGAQFITFQQSFIQGITIRAVYRDTDGKEYLSDPLDPLNPGSSVATVESDKEIARVMWYSLDGRIINTDVQGIVIKCVEYTDGSRSYHKTTR